MNTLKTWFLKNWFITLLVVILLAAVAVRFYKLGSLPHGMTWDEAAIGYNGFSVITTRRDEWLHFLPISFQSFGDYKAPAAIYISGIFTFLLGLNLVAVRLPFALASILAIGSFSLLIWIMAKLTNNKKPLLASLVGATVLTFSPWHIHFSRAGFESGMSLAFASTGVSFLALYILHESKKIKFKNILIILQNAYFTLFIAAGFLAASMYTYHSAKIVTPLLSLLIVALFYQFWIKHLGKLFFVGVTSLLLLTPMAWDSFYGPGATRLSQTSIFSTQGTQFEKAGLLVSNFGAHLMPGFLVLGETPNLRHGAGEWGVLLPTTLVFSIFAVVVFITKKQVSHKKLFLFFIGWTILGILPAALGADEVPHSNRALFALPGFIGLATLGFFESLQMVTDLKINKKIKGNHGEDNGVRDAFIGTVVILHAIFFLSFWHYYTTSFAKNSSSDYQDGYLEAFALAKEYEKGIDGKPAVDKIIFSDEYGQPYIYAIFARKTNNEYYRGGSLIKYEFKNTDIGDLRRTNALVVASQQDTDLPLKEADHIIYGGNGEVRFHLYYLP